MGKQRWEKARTEWSEASTQAMESTQATESKVATSKQATESTQATGSKKATDQQATETKVSSEASNLEKKE